MFDLMIFDIIVSRPKMTHFDCTYPLRLCIISVDICFNYLHLQRFVKSKTFDNFTGTSRNLLDFFRL